MKVVSQTYKDNIKELGKEITYQITYDNTTLGDEDILNANLHYDGGILKSVMKQLDIELYNDLPIGTELNYKFGVKVDDTNYEMVDYGNFIVYSSEKLEDSNTYKLVCYDKMLYAMKDYEALKGKNLFDKDTQDYKKGYYLNASGVETSGANWGVYYIPVIPNTSYTISGCQTNGGVQFCWFNENKTFISAIGQKQNRTMTSPSNAGYIGLSIVWNTSSSAYDNNIMLEKGSTATTYKEYFKYPCTIKNYIDALSYDLSYTFDNDDFTNYDKTIENELYIDNEGNNIGYTYRDVLDELAQATASTICVENDELVLKDITNTNEEKTSISGTSLSMTAHDNNVDIDLLGNTTQNGTPTPTNPVNIETTTGRNVIEICRKNLANNNFEDYDITDGSYAILPIKLEYGKTYVLKATLVGEQKANYYNFGVVKDGTTYNNFVGLTLCVDYSTGTALQRTFTIDNTYTNPKLVCFIQKSQTKFNELFTNYHIQLEKSSSATTYEPYIGNSYEVNLGKNLFDEEQLLQATGWQKQNDIYSGTIDAWYSKFRYGFTGLSFKTNTQYTISLKGYTTGGTPRVQIVYTDNSSELINIYASTMTSYIKTTNASKSVSNIKVDYGTGSANTLYLTQFMIEEGSTASSYSPYFEPIELCKIGNYQDRIFKASGKNLWNIKNGTYTTNGITGVVENGKVILNGTATATAFVQIPINVNINWDTTKTYIVSAFNPVANSDVRLRINNGGGMDTILSSTNASASRIPNNSDMLTNIIAIRVASGTTLTNFALYPMLELETTIGKYEPYGKGWYKYKAIGKVVLNGSENYSNQSGEYDTTTRMMFSVNPSSIPQNMTNRKAVCNYFINYNGSVQNRNVDVTAFNFNNSPQYSNFMYFKLEKSVLPTQDATGFKNWVASHNLIIYYQLATPTYTKIENEELIGQLEHIRLLNGYNNVISSSPITLNYVSGIDTIDEEYLKDINVNFGEMTKPINTITFKRSGDTDVISLSYPEDLEDDKKNEIAISDNQILNYDNRDEYLKGILDKLYGLTYCLNDYTSTGITYYDLCDRYEVSITRTDVDGNTLETNLYPCIMFNDEINVNQGLQEIVHTDRAEESITDYNTTTKTDRLKTRTDLIVNKQEGSIELITADLQINENGESEVINGIIQYQDKNSAIIRAISSSDTTTDENGNIVPTGVKTSTGFTFDKDGLKIQKSDSTYNSLHNERGEYYFDGTTPLGETTPDGSKFKNMDIYGEFRYGKDQIDETSLFVGMLFEDTIIRDGQEVTEECFGHFYNGREVE